MAADENIRTINDGAAATLFNPAASEVSVRAKVSGSLAVGQGILPAEDRWEVLCAIRLGWYLAEVRGRNWPGRPLPSIAGLPGREQHALPLRIERTLTELKYEAEAVLEQLASDLGVNDIVGRKSQRSYSHTSTIGQRVRVLEAAAGTAEAAQAWDALTDSIYALDAHAQDTLTARSEMLAAGYQFGRGLAEAYWALDPAAACDGLTPSCWNFLLGEARCKELMRLAGRLSSYFNPFCAPALAGTVRLWQAIASDQEWRDGAEGHLYRQTRRWYELLILGQDPSTLIKPYQLLRNWHVSLRALRALWVPLTIAAISLGLVIALITVIGVGGSMVLQAVLGVLGAVGLSAAAIQARLKTAAQALGTRLRQDAYTDLVSIAILEAPPKPGARHPDRVVTQEIRKRPLTTAADTAVP